MISSNGVLILLWLLLAVLMSSSVGLILVLVHHLRSRAEQLAPRCPHPVSLGVFVLWPGCWLAIKDQPPAAVQSALHLRNPKPCSWLEGLGEEGKTFIAPPMKGWTLVTGAGLSAPHDDVDVCYRFVLDLSRKLGRVQLFSASRVSRHHAWIEANYGRVVRAYAWAGTTLWNQGPKTPAERALGLTCYDYGETPPAAPTAFLKGIEMNVQSVPLLAARWGFDPQWIDERCVRKGCGIVGELSRPTGAASRLSL